MDIYIYSIRYIGVLLCMNTNSALTYVSTKRNSKG